MLRQTSAAASTSTHASASAQNTTTAAQHQVKSTTAAGGLFAAKRITNAKVMMFPGDPQFNRFLQQKEEYTLDTQEHRIKDFISTMLAHLRQQVDDSSSEKLIIPKQTLTMTMSHQPPYGRYERLENEHEHTESYEEHTGRYYGADPFDPEIVTRTITNTTITISYRIKFRCVQSGYNLRFEFSSTNTPDQAIEITPDGEYFIYDRRTTHNDVTFNGKNASFTLLARLGQQTPLSGFGTLTYIESGNQISITTRFANGGIFQDHPATIIFGNHDMTFDGVVQGLSDDRTEVYYQGRLQKGSSYIDATIAIRNGKPVFIGHKGANVTLHLAPVRNQPVRPKFEYILDGNGGFIDFSKHTDSNGVQHDLRIGNVMDNYWNPEIQTSTMRALRQHDRFNGSGRIEQDNIHGIVTSSHTNTPSSKASAAVAASQAATQATHKIQYYSSEGEYLGQYEGAVNDTGLPHGEGSYTPATGNIFCHGSFDGGLPRTVKFTSRSSRDTTDNCEFLVTSAELFFTHLQGTVQVNIKDVGVLEGPIANGMLNGTFTFMSIPKHQMTAVLFFQNEKLSAQHHESPLMPCTYKKQPHNFAGIVTLRGKQYIILADKGGNFRSRDGNSTVSFTQRMLNPDLPLAILMISKDEFDKQNTQLPHDSNRRIADLVMLAITTAQVATAKQDTLSAQAGSKVDVDAEWADVADDEDVQAAMASQAAFVQRVSHAHVNDAQPAEKG